MATLVLGLAGSALGSSLLGAGVVGFGLTGSQIGYFAGSFLGEALFGAGGSTIKQEGARLSDLKVQTSSYGNMIPIYYGIERGSGNVIWSTELRETTTTVEQDGGGKGGGGQSIESTTYSYSVSFAVSICDTYGRRPKGLRRVWANNELILDFREIAVKNKNFDGSYRLFFGEETQEPSSLQESYLGVGNVPAYRGQMVIEFEDLQLAKFGNRIPSLSFEVVMEGDQVIPNPSNQVHTTEDNNVVVTSGALNPAQIFAFREVDDDTIALGYYNIDTNTFVPVNTYLYDDFPANTVEISMFSYDLGASYVGYIDYFSPLTFRIEKLLSNKVWKGDLAKTHYFDAASYTYIDTLTYVDYGISSFQQNTFGSVFYNEKTCLIYICKQNFVLTNSYLVVVHPDYPVSDLLTGQVYLDGPRVLATHAGIFGNDVYCQPYFNEDLLVGYRATTPGSDAIPVYVYKLDQLGTLTLLFYAVVNSDQDNGVTAFYDPLRSRLVFITRDPATGRLLVTYFSVVRTATVFTPTPESGIAQTFDNDYTVDATPVEVYVTDADGNYVTGVQPEPNFGGLTDAEDAYYFSQGGSNLGKTYNLDPATFQVISESVAGSAGPHNRSGLFAPVYTEPAFIYKNQAITLNQDSGLSRVPRSAPIEGDGVTVASVVSHLSSKVGLENNIDVSELEADIVHGYKIAQVMTARDAIETLQRVYSFDSVESTA